MLGLRFYRAWRGLLVFMGLSLLILPLSAFGWNQTAQAESFADAAFHNLWQRTDAPVAAGIVNRSYVWGDAPFATRQEAYVESPNHLRTVQYFDKGRMELTNPNVNPDNQFYVSSGLLVRDMVGGLVQIGDNRVQVFDPAQIAVVGDALAINPTAPTYADFLLDLITPTSLVRTGDVISTTIQFGRKLGKLPAASVKSDVKYSYYEDHTGHNIASPFWSYFSSKGTVYDAKGTSIANATLFDWQTLMGYPISEAYWTNVKVGGQNTAVLVQLFERRVLSYTPSNPTAFQVEMGNVGQHYYNWRYGRVSTPILDLSVPPSLHGSINPQYGNFDTTFVFTATGFAPGENITFGVVQPNGHILSSPDPLVADAKGQFTASFQGIDFVGTASGMDTSADDSLGIYSLNFKGQTSGNTSAIYYKLLLLPPLTPTTPYANDKSVPDSVNAQVNPQAGPRGTIYSAVFDGFHEKDFAQNRVSLWTTSPEGQVQPVTDASELDETVYGIALVLGAPPRPGIWAVTIQDNQNPQRISIAYIRVTDAPPEATIGGALSLIGASRTASQGLFAVPPHLDLKQ